MSPKKILANAANTLVPAYLALQQKGYAVHCEQPGLAEEVWYAEIENHQFSAADPVSLLGLVALHESRGDGWQATDNEIESFLSWYAP